MTPRVMVVDDEPINIKILSAMLEVNGFQAVAAHSGEDCLLQVRDLPPDVILLDVMMPNMDGFEVVRRLKENEETCIIPVVMVTALSDVKDRIAALDAGADDFLTKPVDKEELVARVRASLKVKTYNDTIRRQQREKDELLNKTLKGTIRMLIEILAITNPVGFSQCSRLVPLARGMAKQLMGKDAWQAELVVMLSPIIDILLPKAILHKIREGTPLELEERKVFLARTRQGVKLLGDIPNLTEVSKALAFRQWGPGREDDPEAGYEADTGDACACMPVSAKIARAAFDYDRIKAKNPGVDAFAIMRRRIDTYDMNVLAVLQDVSRFAAEDALIRDVLVDALEPGMLVAQDVVDTAGRLLVGKGSEVTPLLKLRLQNLVEAGAIGHSMKAYQGAGDL